MRLFTHILKSTAIVIFGLVFIGSTPVTYATISDHDRDSLVQETTFYDILPLGACGTTLGTGSNISTTASQDEIAKTIIGIAKTENLGQAGALIGLMVGITESHLTIYANSTVPLSLDNPKKQAVGKDHDSVGVFQQRPSTGWSTIATGDAALGNKDAIWQLMDPAYSAQAFFGSKPGSNAPPALSKGLQNLPNWQSMDPGAAAQAVQRSAFPDRYNEKKGQAQDYVTRLWNDSPAIASPVAVTGGSSGETIASGSGDCVGAVSGNLMQTIANYAWPDYKEGNFDMKPAYETAVKTAQANGEYIGGLSYPGVDCGGFVTRVMRNSGLDPEYNNKNGNTTYQLQYMEDNPQKYQKLTGVTGVENLQPGDIAIRDGGPGGGHTYIYVGSIPGFNGNAASASLDTRAPMADIASEFTTYAWYRLIK